MRTISEFEFMKSWENTFWRYDSLSVLESDILG